MHQGLTLVDLFDFNTDSSPNIMSSNRNSVNASTLTYDVFIAKVISCVVLDSIMQLYRDS